MVVLAVQLSSCSGVNAHGPLLFFRLFSLLVLLVARASSCTFTWLGPNFAGSAGCGASDTFAESRNWQKTSDCLGGFPGEVGLNDAAVVSGGAGPIASCGSFLLGNVSLSLSSLSLLTGFMDVSRQTSSGGGLYFDSRSTFGGSNVAILCGPLYQTDMNGSGALFFIPFAWQVDVCSGTGVTGAPVTLNLTSYAKVQFGGQITVGNRARFAWLAVRIFAGPLLQLDRGILLFTSGTSMLAARTIVSSVGLDLFSPGVASLVVSALLLQAPSDFSGLTLTPYDATSRMSLLATQNALSFSKSAIFVNETICSCPSSNCVIAVGNLFHCPNSMVVNASSGYSLHLAMLECSSTVLSLPFGGNVSNCMVGGCLGGPSQVGFGGDMVLHNGTVLVIPVSLTLGKTLFVPSGTTVIGGALNVPNVLLLGMASFRSPSQGMSATNCTVFEGGSVALGRHAFGELELKGTMTPDSLVATALMLRSGGVLTGGTVQSSSLVMDNGSILSAASLSLTGTWSVGGRLTSFSATLMGSGSIVSGGTWLVLSQMRLTTSLVFSCQGGTLETSAGVAFSWSNVSPRFYQCMFNFSGGASFNVMGGPNVDFLGQPPYSTSAAGATLNLQSSASVVFSVPASLRSILAPVLVPASSRAISIFSVVNVASAELAGSFVTITVRINSPNDYGLLLSEGRLDLADARLILQFGAGYNADTSPAITIFRSVRGGITGIPTLVDSGNMTVRLAVTSFKIEVVPLTQFCPPGLYPEYACDTPCVPGYYCLSGQLLPCQVGSVAPNPFASTCIQCVPGTFFTNTAAPCVPCSVGTVSSAAGAVGSSVCTPNCTADDMCSVGAPAPIPLARLPYSSNVTGTDNALQPPSDTFSGGQAAVVTIGVIVFVASCAGLGLLLYNARKARVAALRLQEERMLNLPHADEDDSFMNLHVYARLHEKPAFFGCVIITLAYIFVFALIVFAMAYDNQIFFLKNVEPLSSSQHASTSGEFTFVATFWGFTGSCTCSDIAVAGMQIPNNHSSSRCWMDPSVFACTVVWGSGPDTVFGSTSSVQVTLEGGYAALLTWNASLAPHWNASLGIGTLAQQVAPASTALVLQGPNPTRVLLDNVFTEYTDSEKVQTGWMLAHASTQIGSTATSSTLVAGSSLSLSFLLSRGNTFYAIRKEPKTTRAVYFATICSFTAMIASCLFVLFIVVFSIYNKCYARKASVPSEHYQGDNAQGPGNDGNIQSSRAPLDDVAASENNYEMDHMRGVTYNPSFQNNEFES